jgi:pimeloyl-ACP methyl ester carboxylesterase
VLLHGLSGSSKWWSRILDGLAEKHCVAAVDLVGFGRNRRFIGLPLLPPPFGEMTALLARYLETFGEPVHLVGHSMGGQIAIRLAAERPDLVHSLVLVSAAGMPFRFDPRPHVRASTKPPYGGPGIARVLVPDFLRAGPTSVAIAGARVVRADLRELMHAIRIPTLLVWGENDPLVPLVYGEAMREEIAGSQLVVIPHAAHVPMWEEPDAFVRAVLPFLESVPPPAHAEPRFAWGIAGLTNGMAHRQAGPRREVVLLHGLGMSSAYFVHLARELFAHGLHVIAPDLPGFGESTNAPPATPAQHASLLASWADALNIRDALWIGHSTGCNAVAHLATLRPDVVRRAVYIGPLWTRTRFPTLRTFTLLALDAFREPLSLYSRYVIPAYWRVGLARWTRTWLRYARDITTAPPPNATFLAGTRDPLPDRRVVRVVEVEGAHACVYSNPAAILNPAGESPPLSSAPRQP